MLIHCRILTGMQKKQEESMKSYLHEVIKDNNGNLLSLLVRAMLPVEIPAFQVPEGSRNPDSVKWVMNYQL